MQTTRRSALAGTALAFGAGIGGLPYRSAKAQAAARSFARKAVALGLGISGSIVACAVIYFVAQAVKQAAGAAAPWRSCQRGLGLRRRAHEIALVAAGGKQQRGGDEDEGEAGTLHGSRRAGRRPVGKCSRV